MANLKTRTEMSTMMKDSKGDLFTVVFDTKEKKNREITGTLHPTTPETPLGYLVVILKDLDDKDRTQVRNVNPRTLKSLIIGGERFVRK